MTDSVGFETYYEGTFVPLKVWNIRSKVALQRKSGFWLVHVRFSSETNHWIITNLNAYTRTGSFYCWAIFRHRENTPRLASRARMGGFEIASNPMRVPIHERVHVDAFVWFSNMEAISNRAERNVVSAVTGTHFRRPSCFINVHLRNLIM